VVTSAKAPDETCSSRTVCALRVQKRGIWELDSFVDTYMYGSRAVRW